MTLEEILQEVDIRVSNTVSRDTKVRWVNQIQKRLYRVFRYPPSYYEFQTVPQQADYPLPADCAEDQILDIIYDGSSIPRFSPGHRIPGQYSWSIYAGFLRIQPTPIMAVPVTIVYVPKYTDLSNDEDVSKLPEDFHEILVVGCAARVAQASDNPQLASSLSQEFTQMVSEAMITFKPPYEPTAPANALPWTR